MYASDHTLITASGALPGGEKWSCGLRTTGRLAPGSEQDTAAGCLDAWRLFLQTSDARVSTGTTLERVQLREVSRAGVTLAIWDAAPGSPVSGATTPALPNQCAIVMTLLTAKAGRSGKGRIYLPLLGLTTPAGGRLLAGINVQISALAANLMADLNTALRIGSDATGNTIAVQSQSSVTASPVTGIRIGDVVDTQRRRRNELVESYSSRAVVPNRV